MILDGGLTAAILFLFIQLEWLMAFEFGSGLLFFLFGFVVRLCGYGERLRLGEGLNSSNGKAF